MKVQIRTRIHRAAVRHLAPGRCNFGYDLSRKTLIARASTEEQAVEPGVSGAKPEEGRMTYNPATFDEIVTDASNAVIRGLNAGYTKLEVEFPTVNSSNTYENASDTYIDSNIQLALQAARNINKETGKTVAILVPDGPEYERASQLFKTALEMSGDGVVMGHLFEGREPLAKGFKMLLGLDSEDKVPEKLTEADLHIIVNISTNELADVRAYSEQVVKEGGSLLFWCCELDTLRGDLGLFGFPPKSMQYDYLCQFKPMFYVRQRDYSKTVNVAPFIVNYSGCLFREYPGPWQIMLRQVSGEYACVAEDPTRYTLFEVKEELGEAMGLNTEEKGSAMQFLRKGYKTSTWWEDDEAVEKFDSWRT